MKRSWIAIPLILSIGALLLTNVNSSASVAAVPAHARSAACGVWSTVASPNPGTSSNFLNGVAALSASNVWAVGTYGNGNGSFPLVEHWKGSKWTVASSPTIKAGSAYTLNGVIALAANNAWIVGAYNNASNIQQTLIEHWNGSKWSIVASPNVASLFNVLTAVSATSARDIWAVGNSSGINGYQTLIEHWNGSKWSIVAGTHAGQLNSVKAISSNNAWAVGNSPAKNSTQTLIEHWNGFKWSAVASPGTGFPINNLSAVAALSPSNIWAAGDGTSSPAPSATYTPLIEHWNGSRWSIVKSLLQGTSDLVNGVAAVAPNNIWVVGDYRSSTDPMGPYYTLIEHWNGSKWSVVKSPSPGSIASDLLAAARVPNASAIWSVGFIEGSIYQTLTETGC
jgi:hypothetical protein